MPDGKLYTSVSRDVPDGTFDARYLHREIVAYS